MSHSDRGPLSRPAPSMASNFESALNIASSTPDSSPSDILGETKIRRPLVKIPAAQKKLLTGHESWESLLSRRPNGFINVPPCVLEQVKASYARQKRAARSNHVVEFASQTEDDADPPEPSGSQSSLPPRVQEDGEESGDDDGGADEPASWPQSPETHLQPPRVESEEQSQPFMTQLPEKSPPQPTVMTSPPEHSKLLEFPQSSQGPEDELEVEVPVALTYSPVPINKSALPMLATPPSAQVVPCTFEQSIQSDSTIAWKNLDLQRKPKPKTHIYNRVPELYRGPKQGAVSSYLNPNMGSNKATAVLGHNADAESSLSIYDTSSPVIPSTTNDPGIEGEKHTRVGDVKPSQRLTYGTDLGSNNLHSPSASGSYSPVQMQPAPLHAMHSPQAAPPVAHSAVPPAVASKGWEAPFIYYTVTYPDYHGTMQDFITACIYIQLQYRRIRTSLYDDFIRAWVEGYLPYIKDCDEATPPRKALRAIEWYNEIDDDPLYTSRVVTRQNLQSVLNFYPSELEMARLSLGILSSQGSSQHPVPNSQPEPCAQNNHISQSGTHPQQSKGKEPIRKAVEAPEVEVGGSELLPLPKPKLPPFATDQKIPAAHRSVGGIESRPAQHKGFSRSLSESTLHKKRTAINKLRTEETKRISLGPTPSEEPMSSTWRMRPGSGSTVSNHSERSRNTAQTSIAPESATRKQSAKITEDAEERRKRRLAKHFKKRMAGRGSIASSAPVSNTPTSGGK
ncbi:hypothetical protein F4823DRAFT_616836 [Ustulina deusta]|nr:hypothetical protein F4823DRAFT_616836 [Ustulina deusta]